MNQEVVKKLKKWRSEVGRRESLELFRIIPNKTIDDIAMLLPKNKDELLAVKGIREKKFQKYGRDILAIVNGLLGNEAGDSNASEEDADKIYTVSSYLDLINANVSRIGAGIRGEVSSVSFKGHLYFSLKDADDGSVLNCFMWSNDYEISGIEIKEGMELTVYGFPEIYKPNGRFTFRVSAIELVGEGALKKAYDDLKNKLEQEGLFDESRKKILPEYPHRIGLITSRDGAVINDFLNNIGRFGYDIKFVDSRVEGAMAVKDLIEAVRYFKDKSLDILVIIRGGGSLESLQAFNNESLIREVVNLEFPVICGIGHDKDVPLLSYVADKAVSTPSIVAKEINKSWERAIDRLDYYESKIVSTYSEAIMMSRHKLERASGEMEGFYKGIFRRFEEYQFALKNILFNISYVIKKDLEMLNKMPRTLQYYFNRLTLDTAKIINNYEKSLNQNNPERQLKLGYSIVTVNGKIVKSISQVKLGDEIISKVGDGEIRSEVKKIN